MADTEQQQLALLSLEDDLTCSICLSPFDCPVTIPCGHNFCQDCLLSTWEDSYSCPQCRTVFESKPELKKNTVLSSLVETLSLGPLKCPEVEREEEEAEEDDIIRCDTCQEAKASQTCLTCMASFCEEHLRPHRENPNFRVHQLSEPVGDLMERICPDHHKLMEFFCSQHDRAICSICLQQVHKGCSFMSPEEQRNLKETDFREKLGILDDKIERTNIVQLQVTEIQSKVKDVAAKKKTTLGAVYQQMREMLAQEERQAQLDVDFELESVQTRLQNFRKRLSVNIEHMTKAREDISNSLSQAHTLAFLQASFHLPNASKFDPYAPRITLDSKKVMATQAFAASLKEHLAELLKEPVEARLPILSAGDAAGKKEAPVAGSAGSQPQPVHVSEQPNPPEQKTQSVPQGLPFQKVYQPVPVPIYVGAHHGWQQHYYGHSRPPGSHRGPPGHKPSHKSDGSHHSTHKHDKKPSSAPGGHKPHGKGSDHPKKDHPRGQPSPGKPGGPHPRPHKNK